MSQQEHKVRRRRANVGVVRVVSSATAALQTLTFRQKMIAGAVARGIAQSILHPIDVVRTRVQAINVSGGWRLETFTRGLSPQIILAIPAGAIQFVSFEGIKEWLREKGIKGESATLVASAGGAAAAALFRVPQEVLKQPIQAGIYSNMFQAIKGIIGTKGIGGLYNGSIATISRDVPWNALAFTFHAQGKRIFRHLRKREPANDENLFIGGVAGAAAAVIMTPVDVVKTRIMTQRADAAKQYVDIFHTFVSIAKNEGPRTFMKGVVPRVVYLAPLAGITLSVYEAVVRIFLQKGNEASVASRNQKSSWRVMQTPRFASYAAAGKETMRSVAIDRAVRGRSPIQAAFTPPPVWTVRRPACFLL